MVRIQRVTADVVAGRIKKTPRDCGGESDHFFLSPGGLGHAWLDSVKNSHSSGSKVSFTKCNLSYLTKTFIITKKEKEKHLKKASLTGVIHARHVGSPPFHLCPRRQPGFIWPNYTIFDHCWKPGFIWPNYTIFDHCWKHSSLITIFMINILFCLDLTLVSTYHPCEREFTPHPMGSEVTSAFISFWMTTLREALPHWSVRPWEMAPSVIVIATTTRGQHRGYKYSPKQDHYLFSRMIFFMKARNCFLEQNTCWKLMWCTKQIKTLGLTQPGFRSIFHLKDLSIINENRRYWGSKHVSNVISIWGN